MFRLTIDNAKDYIGKTCLVLCDTCFVEDKIVSVDRVIHLEHCRDRDTVYILDVLEICGPLQKGRVKVGDTGVFFDILNDLSLLSTYKMGIVQDISTNDFTDWPYISEGKEYRYFLPMKEVPDVLHSV